MQKSVLGLQFGRSLIFWTYYIYVAWTVVFLFRLDLITSKIKVKTEWSDFRFVKLCCIRQQTEWMKMQIHSLTAGGAYAVIQHVLGFCYKQSRAAIRNSNPLGGKRKKNAKDGPFLQSPFKAASHVISLNGETSHSPKLFTKLMIKFHIWKHQWNLTTTVS